MIVVRTADLTKRYGTFVALDSLNLDVHEGEVLGYLGPNGAGKTTTIRLILGLIEASSGSVELFGEPAGSSVIDLHRRIGFVPGDAELWPMLTGGQTLDFLGRLHGSVDARYRDELIERFAFDPSKKVGSYSKGNRQKVNLIAALMVRPPLLILDEPTSGLDPLMEEVFKSAVLEAKDRGQTVILSSHILSEVEALCDRVAIVREGRLIESGTLDELRLRRSVMVELRFSGPVPVLDGVEGVSNVSVRPDGLTCTVDGSIGPLLDAIRGADVVQMLSREPSLEELFLSHYDASVARPERGVAAHGR
jgi:ABC-2 type transport system ATP-binding protein